MFRLLQAALFLSVGLCFGAQQGAASDQKIGSVLTDGADGIALVSGKVTAVEKVREAGTQATIKIVHVFSGPKTLQGSTFVQPTAEEGDAGSLAIPLLKIGETGLWLMGTDQNTGNLVWNGYYRKAHTANYERKVEWAEAIERLVKLKVGERLKAAKVLCGHKTPEVAQLGIEVLFGAYAPDAERAGVPEFIEGLPKNKAVTRFALIRADRLSIEMHGKKWIASEMRKALMARLTGELLTDEEGKEFATHITSPWTIESFTIQELAAPLGKIISNHQQSNDVRSAAVARLIYAARMKGSLDDAFDILVEAVKRDDAMRVTAAQGFAELARTPVPPMFPKGVFSQTRIDVLRSLLKDEKNADVAKALKAALDKTK